MTYYVGFFYMCMAMTKCSGHKLACQPSVISSVAFFRSLLNLRIRQSGGEMSVTMIVV